MLVNIIPGVQIFNCQARRLHRAEAGAAALIFSLAMFIVIGGMAFTIDVSRIYAVKARLSIAVEMAATAAATNLHFLPEDDLGGLAAETVNATFRQMNLLAYVGSSPAPPTVSIITDILTGRVTVTAEAAVSTTLMRTVSFFDDVTVSKSITAEQTMPEAELALVLDASASMESFGKLEDVKSASRDFIARLGSEARRDIGATLALAPVGNGLVNIAPHKDWVATGSWPVNIPPRVPGVAAWTGELADQRWCVDSRAGAAGVDDTPPDQVKFPLVLGLSSVLDPLLGLPLFTVTTTDDCRNDRILPLNPSFADIDAEISSLSGVGETALGRGMLWAERLLSPRWQALWDGNAASPVAYYDPAVEKIAILVAGTGNSDEAEDLLFSDVCTRLKTNGVTLYVIDYLAPTSFAPGLQECATSAGHYFDVSSATELSEAFISIAKFISVVRFNG